MTASASIHRLAMMARPRPAAKRVLFMGTPSKVCRKAVQVLVGPYRRNGIGLGHDRWRLYPFSHQFLFALT
jgi:hypothetical protein